eukprot:Clim_evm11s196 gene=Clim_evmTU11s196
MSETNGHVVEVDFGSLNPRVEAMKPSATGALFSVVADMERQGTKVLRLNVGEPDFSAPPEVIAGGMKTLTDGDTFYTENQGSMALRQSICKKLERDNGLKYTPQQVVVSNGAKQSIQQVIMALVRPGDEVIVPAPFWVSYPEMVRYAGGIPVMVNTEPENGFCLTAEQLKQALTEKTRILILCSPSNPTGGIYSETLLKELASVLRECAPADCAVLTDEIYEYINFGDVPHCSMAALSSDMYARTFTVNGFSKGYAMTGFRLGYVAAPTTKLAGILSRIQGQTTGCPSSVSQRAGISGLEELKPEYFEKIANVYKERRDCCMKILRKTNLKLHVPPGAFYLFPLVDHLYGKTYSHNGEIKTIKNSYDMAGYLLAVGKVALMPGAPFGDDRGIRIAYANSIENLTEAMEAIVSAINALE